LALIGHVDLISRLSIRGWAADSDDIERVILVNIIINDEIKCVLSAHVDRPDLAKTGQHGSGKRGFVHYFSPALPTDDRFEIIIQFLDTKETLPNGEAILECFISQKLDEFLQKWAARSLPPVFVTGLPRSGTTLLMSKLQNHSAISVIGSYPFEYKLATYYGNVLRILQLPGNHEKSMHQNDLNQKYHSVGFNPFYYDLFLSDFNNIDTAIYLYNNIATDEIKAVFAEIVRKFYLSASWDKNNLRPRYFGEKLDIATMTRPLVLSMFAPAKEIVLIRDLRDIYCSQRSYFKAETTVVNELREQGKIISQIYTSRTDNILFIKYEDLILDEATVMARIWEFLALLPPKTHETSTNNALFTLHATAASPKESIGRWKRDLDPQDQQVCDREFADFLWQFGYNSLVEPSRTPPGA